MTKQGLVKDTDYVTHTVLREELDAFGYRLETRLIDAVETMMQQMKEEIIVVIHTTRDEIYDAMTEQTTEIVGVLGDEIIKNRDAIKNVQKTLTKLTAK